MNRILKSDTSKHLAYPTRLTKQIVKSFEIQKFSDGKRHVSNNKGYI